MQVSLAAGARWALEYYGDGVLKKVELLIEFGADVCHRDFKMATPLHLAAEAQNPEAVSAILSVLNMRSFVENPVNMIDVAFHTPLHDILSLDEGLHTKAIVKMLLEAGADLNASTSGPVGYGALMFNESTGIESIFSVGTVSICVQTPIWGVSLTGDLSNFQKLFNMPSTTLAGKTLLRGCSRRMGSKESFEPLDVTENISVLGTQRTLGFSIGFTRDKDANKTNEIRTRSLISMKNIQANVEHKLTMSIPLTPEAELKRMFTKYHVSTNTGTTAAHLFFSKGLGNSQLLRDLIEPLYNPMVLDPEP